LHCSIAQYNYSITRLFDHPIRQPEQSSPAGVGGWLLLLCRLLIVFHPLSLAVTAAGALNALSVRGAPVAIIVVLRLLVVALGVAAGLALQGRRPGSVLLTKVALVLSAATDVFVYTTPYFPNNRAPGDTTLVVIASLGYHALWLAYLQRSRRVRVTFR
jgi:hypothetical protein